MRFHVGQKVKLKLGTRRSLHGRYGINVLELYKWVGTVVEVFCRNDDLEPRSALVDPPMPGINQDLVTGIDVDAFQK